MHCSTKPWQISVLSGVLAFTAPVGLQAAVLVSNLDQPPIAVPTTVPDDAGWAAQSFVTDAAAYSLTSIEIVAGALVGSPTVVAELRAGDVLSVGATIGTFDLPSFTTGDPLNVILTPSSAFTLTPNTTYWLVLGTIGAGSFDWTYAETNLVNGPGALGNFAYSEDFGITWGAFSEVKPYLMKVQVAPVPIPAAGWLLASGILLLLGARSREM
jgi:hypothetical protein